VYLSVAQSRCVFPLILVGEGLFFFFFLHQLGFVPPLPKLTLSRPLFSTAWFIPLGTEFTVPCFLFRQQPYPGSTHKCPPAGQQCVKATFLNNHRELAPFDKLSFLPRTFPPLPFFLLIQGATLFLPGVSFLDLGSFFPPNHYRMVFFFHQGFFFFSNCGPHSHRQLPWAEFFGSPLPPFLCGGIFPPSRYSFPQRKNLVGPPFRRAGSVLPLFAPPQP